MWQERQAIEVFHLLFLAALRARVDPGLYVLKGGCNLRFFCRSIRYSQDMDLDVHTIAVETLRKNVDKILESSGFHRTLRAQKLELASSSAPKQTATTQRWKAGIRTGDTPRDIPTKIEFSRRHLDPDYVLEPVDGELVSRYRLYPVLVQHYTPAAAFRQKIKALAQRNETQARDVFDLKLLLDAGAAKEALPPETRKLLPEAIEHAMGVGYDDFNGQVVAFLDPDYRDYYGTRQAWDRMQDEVVVGLEALTP